MIRNNLDPEDQVKIDTWYHLTTLLEEYHLLAFGPTYQSGLKLFASKYDRETRELKLQALQASRERLFAKWEKALGPKWPEALIQQD